MITQSLLASSAVKNASNQSPTATKTLGYFAQEQFAFRDRLFVTGALRTDQNTAFGTQFASVTYPSAQVAWEAIEADGSQEVLGFGTALDNRWFLARFMKPEAMAELAPKQSPAWRGLAVSILHRLVLEKLVDERLGGRPGCQYVHRLDEVIAAVSAKSCDLAALVPPVTVEHVETIAGRHETMPAKSTYFYPKVLTGLVFNSLKSH